MEQVRKPLHPLVGAAAVSVILLSAAGIAALTGVLPRSTANQPASVPQELQAAAAPSAAPTPASVVSHETPAPAAKKAHAKPVEKHASPRQEATTARAETPAPVAPAPVLAQAPAVPVPPPPEAAPVVEAARPIPCANCGVIENFREVQAKGEGSGLGAIAGGVGGLILGRQVGRGGGRDIATIAGAVGGALAGNEIEKRTRTQKQYEVSVRMDDGSLRTLTLDTPPVWRAGERVRVEDDQIRAI